MPRKYLFSSIDSFFGPEPSTVMQQIIQTVERVALSDLGILVVGEKGTGKSWLAQMVHKLSGRANHPVISFDCASMGHADVERIIFGSDGVQNSRITIHQGLLEQVAGGTIIFHKISELSHSVQMKIIRTFEHQHYRKFDSSEHSTVNVRMISTMRKNSSGTDDKNEIGKEIYHRICPVTINLPPLRERKEDISFLIEYFIKESNVPSSLKPQGITVDALSSCMKHHWPGNVSELKRVIVSAMKRSAGNIIRLNHLPAYIYAPGINIPDHSIEEIGI